MMMKMKTRYQRLRDLTMQHAAWQVETHQEAVKMPQTEAKLELRILARMRQLIQPPLNVAKKA